MVAKNPYIVKETEGNAYTIRQYVTGRPLTASELIPDEHGIYPVNPLGFGMAPDGSVLETAEPTMGMMAYPIYYGDMYGIPAPTPEDEGKQVPPEVLYGYVKYHLVGPYSIFSGTELRFPVLSVTVDDEDPSLYVVVVFGDIRDCDDDSRTARAIRLYNVTTDDYAPTGLIDENGFDIDSVSVADGVSTIKVRNQPGAPFSGIAGPGKLELAILYETAGDGPNLMSVKDNHPEQANGIFVVGNVPGEPFRKVCSLPEPEEDDGGEDVPTCNARNGYGSSEVRDWVSGRVGGIIGHGKHPSPYPGELTGAGAFVQWFVSCADVDISGGVGDNQVMVPGFGLGSGYFQSCVTGERAPEGKPETEVKDSQWITFGYGTAHDDVLPGNTGVPALPMDWPFTDNSQYANTTVDNSITLIRKGALVNDKVYGRLDRIDPECTRCDGHGTIADDDGNDVPCPICHGTGEVPECGRCHGTGKVDDKDCPVCLGSGHSAKCDVCDGTGAVNGFRCSTCGGTGTVHGKNVDMNKVHVCLYNDFEPSNSDNGHTAGTTVLKKTFVNLATPITTKDGDEFEITVSLPNVSLDKAFKGDNTDDLKNLSGYYAYISQPRVYVMSGTWKFSETPVEFTISGDLTKVKLSEEFLDTDGNPLPDGTDVRVKLSFGSYKKKDFDMTGVLAQVDGNPGIELYDTFDVDENVKRLLTIPPTRKTPNTICGAAYVEPNNGTLPEGSTPIGLNAVRCEDGVLGVDFGETDGGVEQYNKLYTVDQDDDTRHHVLFDDEGNPKNDQRQVVATVYPTVTNTFPWTLTHRRKQNFLEKMMTNEADLGCNSLFAYTREMDLDIIGAVNATRPTEYDAVAFTPEEYPIDLAVSRDYIANRYGDSLKNNISFIGAVLSVAQYDEPSPEIPAQPVRQAIKAVKLLSRDYRNSRARWTTYDISSSDSILKNADPIDTSWDLSGKDSLPMQNSNKYEEMANEIRLSHLPTYIATAGTSDTGEPISPLLYAYPYVGDEYSYYASNPYEYDTYGTTDKISDTPCEVTNNTSTRVFSVNSIVNACTEKNIPWLQNTSAYDDLLRAAELSAINFNDSGVLRTPVSRYSSPWLEPLDAFTKILSPDNIPVPSVQASFKYDDAGMTEKQYAFIAGDAYGYYKLLNDWASMSNDEFIATTMPTDDSLARFLKEYVSSYGSAMTVRHWDGFRVKVKAEPTEYDRKKSTFLTRMAWNGTDCEDSYRGEYAADAFVISYTFDDPNLNRLMFNSAYEALSMDYSVPPYSCTRDYRSRSPFATYRDQNAVGYVRVFMKFTFCADAGRWYCVDYRQAPVSYLSPLYGANALEETIDGHRVWIPPGCGTYSWRDALSHTYEEYRPMDINPAIVNEVVSPRPILEQGDVSIEYVPSRNVENSCINGIEFTPDSTMNEYHVSIDLEWSDFTYIDHPEQFDCRFQGARYDKNTEEWVWEGSNDLCAALNNVIRPKELLLANPSGTYHYEADFDISSTWFYYYSKCYVGLRTDFSNGRGTLAIKNLKVTNIRNRLALSYKPVSEGGLGLNAPLDRNGYGVVTDYEKLVHANFWSVRPHLRPATGAVAVGDIPHYYRDDDMYKQYEPSGGIMADSVLWGQYDYPEKNEVEYHLPDTEYPDVDRAVNYLVYAKRNGTTNLMDTGNIQLGNHKNFILTAAMPGEPIGPVPPHSGEWIIAKDGINITLGEGVKLAYHKND